MKKPQDRAVCGCFSSSSSRNSSTLQNRSTFQSVLRHSFWLIIHYFYMFVQKECCLKAEDLRVEFLQQHNRFLANLKTECSGRIYSCLHISAFRRQIHLGTYTCACVREWNCPASPGPKQTPRVLDGMWLWRPALCSQTLLLLFTTLAVRWKPLPCSSTCLLISQLSLAACKHVLLGKFSVKTVL